jgi:Mn-dependent DtxR family transcriptional regulator
MDPLGPICERATAAVAIVMIAATATHRLIRDLLIEILLSYLSELCEIACNMETPLSTKRGRDLWRNAKSAGRDKRQNVGRRQPSMKATEFLTLLHTSLVLLSLAKD